MVLTHAPRVQFPAAEQHFFFFIQNSSYERLHIKEETVCSAWTSVRESELPDRLQVCGLLLEVMHTNVFVGELFLFKRRKVESISPITHNIC